MLWTFLILQILVVFFDNMLILWFINKDPDASIIHYHMIRSILVFTAMILVKGFKRPRKRKILWWIKWTLCGFVLPHITYAYTIKYVDIGILLPYIPYLSHRANDTQRVALILLFGMSLYQTVFIRFTEPILFETAGLIAGCVHVLSLTSWYKSLEDCDMFAEMCVGQFFASLLFSLIWFDESTSSLEVFHSSIYVWFGYLLLSCIVVVLKYIMINRFSGDTIITIFECLHPIATNTYRWDALGILFAAFIFLYKDLQIPSRCTTRERSGAQPYLPATYA